MVIEPNCVPSILGFIFTYLLAAHPTTALPETWAYCSATCRPHRQPAPDPPCSGREPPGADRRGVSAPPAYLPVLLPPPGSGGPASRGCDRRLRLPLGRLLRLRRLTPRCPASRPRTLGRLPRARRSRLPPS